VAEILAAKAKPANERSRKEKKLAQLDEAEAEADANIVPRKKKTK
jgi:hypothetical protein